MVIQQIVLQHIAPVTATCIVTIALLLMGLLLYLSKLLATRLAPTAQGIKPSPQRQQEQLRRQLLHQVKQEVAAQLATQPELSVPLQYLWNGELRVGQKAVKRTTTRHMLEAFQQPQMARRLLILGASGIGKTTLLMNLVAASMQRSPASLDLSLPVLLNLSSWTKRYLSFEQWFLTELKAKYGLRLDVGQYWLETHQLLPFLEGLDELDEELQSHCLQAINQFQQTFQLPGLVVCGQPEAYQRCGVPLNVGGTIWLQPLTASQVQTHLQAIASRSPQGDAPPIWQSIDKDPQLMRLAQLPLMLHLLPQVASVSQISHAHDLLALYVQKKLGRDNPYSTSPQGQEPQPSQTLHWLTWLAKSLQKRGQSEFLIERMQPSWLPSRTHQLLHRMSVVLIAAVLVGAIAAITDSISTLRMTSPVFWSVIAGAIALRYPQGIAAFPEQINLLETLSWSHDQARRGLLIGLLQGTIGSLCLGVFLLAICSVIFLIDPIYLKTIRETLISGIFLGSVIILTTGLMGALLTGLLGSAIERRIFSNQGIWRSAKNTFIFALIGFVIGSLVTGLFSGIINLFFDIVSSMIRIPLSFSILYYPPVMLKTGIMIGVMSGLSVGIACLQHFVLRVMLWYNGSIPWNYARFLRYVTQRSLMQQFGGRYRFTHRLLQDYLAHSYSPSSRSSSRFSEMPVIGSKNT